MAGEFKLISTDQLFAKIEDQLNSYVANGILDVGRFYNEVKWFIQKLGIADQAGASAGASSISTSSRASSSSTYTSRIVSGDPLLPAVTRRHWAPSRSS